MRNNLVKWAVDGAAEDAIDGVVLSPFCTPRVGNTYKPSAATTIQRLREGGVNTIWFDPASHVLQMPSVGDFRYYDQWNLWTGQRGAAAFNDYRSHCEQVFAVQDDLDVPRLAPTVLLDNPTSQLSDVSLRVARWAVDSSRDEGKEIYLTVAGTSSFWSERGSLDAHVGALAQLSPNGWFAVQARGNSTLPVQTTRDEVYGLCRTARSLSEDRSIFHVSHGDFAALPAVAAGATMLGTGWDTRQRACAATNYAARSDGEGGSWFKRPTIQGLFGFLSRQDAELVETRNAALSAQVVPGPLHPDAPKEAFLHHAHSLQRIARSLTGDYRSRYETLRDLYNDAMAVWPSVTAITHSATRGDSWVTPFQAGLILYGQSEGW